MGLWAQIPKQAKCVENGISSKWDSWPRRQKLLEKHDLALLQGKTLKKDSKGTQNVVRFPGKNKTRSLKVENKQMALKMGSRANGILGSILENKRLNGIPFARERTVGVLDRILGPRGTGPTKISKKWTQKYHIPKGKHEKDTKKDIKK